jgi:dUTP pyrophosphatase
MGDKNMKELAYFGEDLVKGTRQSAGFDIPLAEEECIPARGIIVVPTGLRVALPEGSFGLVVPRSSTPIRWGITLANSPGIIDEDYRGEIKLILLNLKDEDVKIPKGTKVAQLIVLPFMNLEPTPFQGTLEEFEQSSERGTKGLGSSGV